MNKATVGMMI